MALTFSLLLGKHESMPSFFVPTPSPSAVYCQRNGRATRRERLMRPLGMFFLTSALLLSAPRAHADEATAQALFEAGVAARENGELSTACDQFEASNDLDSAPGTVLNLADCREQLGQLAQAWQRYVEVSEILPSDDERVPYARKKAEELKARLPSVTLSWALDTTRGEIYLDGKRLPESVVGVPLPVDPGAHRYVVRSPDRQDAVIEVSLREGESKALELAAGPLRALPSEGQASAPQGSEASDSDPLRMVAWTSLGAGAASLAVGTITGIMAMGKASTVEEDCLDDYCRTQEGKDAADAGNTLATVSTVTFIAGGVLAATGITLLVVGPDSEQESAARSRRLSIAAGPLIGGGALRLKGAF